MKKFAKSFANAVGFEYSGSDFYSGCTSDIRNKLE